MIDKILGAAGLDADLEPAHLRHALRKYERHYNEHLTHGSLAAQAPLRVRPEPLGSDQIERFAIDRQDRLGGVIHEYHYAA